MSDKFPTTHAPSDISMILKLSDMDKETSARIVAAREAGKQYMENEPLAEKAYYDRDLKRIVIHLNNDFMLCISPSKIQGLEGASEKDLDDIEILPPGIGVRWDRLDVDMSVAGLASSIYGSRAWMKELARRGGKSQSPAKVAAAKANGKKGGRPRDEDERYGRNDSYGGTV